MRTKLFTLVALLFATTFVTKAQTAFKIGYTNVDVVLLEMPESKQIESELKIKQTQYEKLIQEKVKTYEEKVKEYQQNEKNFSDVIKADKVKSIQNLEGEIQEFQKNAQGEMQKKQGELLQPVLNKIQDAINAVAKENAYSYILNTAADAVSTPLLLFADEQYNITELVFKKLNITPKPKTTAPATTAPKK
jgi:outer membrane protein